MRPRSPHSGVLWLRISAIVVAAAAAWAATGCHRLSRDDAPFRPLALDAAVPPYAVRTLDGALTQIGGAGPPTVLNVWATWCASCLEEMADLDSLARDFAPVRVVAVSIDEGGSEAVRRFAASRHFAFLIGLDSVAEIERLYRLEGVPATFVIGRDGRLLWRHTGALGDSLASARAAVRRALAQGR